MIGCRFFLQRVNRKETVSIRFMLHFLWGWSLNAWSGRICISTKSGTKFAVLELSQYLRLSLSVKRDFFTRKAAPVWLASTATAEARNAGTNIYGIRVLHQIQGTIAAFSTQIGGVSFASAGMTCRTCKKEGFRIVSATAVAPDRHPEMIPGSRELKVKLVFADRSGILLGGQISGGPSVGELINT